MPELPEVETVRLGLARHLTGARIETVTCYHPRAVRLQSGGDKGLRAAMVGRTITAWVRRGKYLWANLDNGAAVSFHLRMSGQLLINPTALAPTEHLRLAITLTLHGEQIRLWFVDQRTFGYLRCEPLVPTSDGAAGGCGSDVAALPASVAHIARDGLDPHLDVPAVIAAMRQSSSPIKALILRQDLVSGIGNIYADEALWHARIHPARPGRTLTALRVAVLLGAASRVMAAATAAGGTSFDDLYVDVAGASGWFTRELVAYGRAGAPCRRCGAALVRSQVAGRSATWCPKCTRAPR